MPMTYRRPGVYLEESLLVNPSDVAGAATVAAFIGVAEKGPILEPTLVESWSDYVTAFGSMSPITPPTGTVKVLSYLPFALYSYFQNGGRSAWVIRATPTATINQGLAATIVVNGTISAQSPLRSFSVSAKSAGTWGNRLKYGLTTQSLVGTGNATNSVFAIQVLLTNAEGIDEVVETFPSLSIKGEIPGTRKVDAVVNDALAGSVYIRITQNNELQPYPVQTTSPVALAGGIDPDIPDAAALVSATALVAKVEGPIILNIVGYLNDASMADTSGAATAYVGATVPSTVFTDRSDIFVVNDSAVPRIPGQTSAAYKSTITTALGANTGDSYSASYGPWCVIPNPSRVGTTLSIPPAGAVMGMMARIDSTVGVFRAPAGVIAGLSNVIGVQTKFTDTEMGDLNAQNINIIRSVTGAGICVMGARTRKSYGADRYISARRTLIYVKEVLRRSTQFAVFENNDQRLWSGLRMSADRILRPLWEAGGLRGASSAEAYFIRCDDTINTPAVIQSGEVRMEVGVSLEYPAEFVVIRITQFDRGTFTTEVQPSA